MNGARIPHLRIVVAVSAFVLAGFAVVSGYVIGWSDDEVTKGNIIGTWQNFALLAVGFWLGSSSAGKAKEEPSGPSGTLEDPVHVDPKPELDLAHYRQPGPGQYGP
jgi:hypothetical protein